MIEHTNRIHWIAKSFLSVAVSGGFFFITCLTPSEAGIQRLPDANPYWNNFLTDAINDLDFDARNAQNRKVATPAARAALKELFVFKVFQLMVADDLPSLARVRKMLAEAINPFAEKISNATRHLWEALQAALFLGVRPIHRLSQAFRNPPGHPEIDRAALDFYSAFSFQAFKVILPLRC